MSVHVIIIKNNFLRLVMFPSYPRYVFLTDLAIRFAVPNQDIVRKILHHCEQEEDPRLKAAGNVLYPQIQSLARIMSRHRIRLDTIGSNELGITLFLPPSPCPPPKSSFGKLFSRFKRPKSRISKLATIDESPEDDYNALQDGMSSSWITLYEYLPYEKRHGMYIAHHEGTTSIKLQA